MLTLYADPISTTSRAVLFYLSERSIDFKLAPISLMAGAHLEPDFAAINPNKAVPVLVDGAFTLSECSAILKYLAEGDAAWYPRDLKARARVHQMMDWLNTGFSRDFAYGLVYPQIFPHHVHENGATQAEVLKRAGDRAAFWFGVLDAKLGQSASLCGEAPTIADALGAAYVSIADWIDFDLSTYPNVSRWLRMIRARPAWIAVNGPWDALTANIRAQKVQAA